MKVQSWYWGVSVDLIFKSRVEIMALHVVLLTWLTREQSWSTHAKLRSWEIGICILWQFQLTVKGGIWGWNNSVETSILSKKRVLWYFTLISRDRGHMEQRCNHSWTAIRCYDRLQILVQTFMMQNGRVRFGGQSFEFEKWRGCMKVKLTTVLRLRSQKLVKGVNSRRVESTSRKVLPRK